MVHIHRLQRLLRRSWRDQWLLAQAISVKWLLRRRGIEGTLYLGAAFDDRRSLEAHAWLRCGPIFVTGGDGSRKYGPLAVFGKTETQ